MRHIARSLLIFAAVWCCVGLALLIGAVVLYWDTLAAAFIAEWEAAKVALFTTGMEIAAVWIVIWIIIRALLPGRRD